MPGRTFPGNRPVDQADYTKGIDDQVAKSLISEAQGWLGTPYQYGGISKSGTDCSGFVMSVYRNACGVNIPRSTREQIKYCKKIARNRMKPGDLIFFAPGKEEDKVGHVGMYIGDGRMIHASSSRGVIVSDFDSGYWAERYLIGGKVEAAGAWRNGRKPEEMPSDVVVPSYDVIDDIINQKIDSIFSSQFFE